jgi:FkbM family methyltransferase
MKKSPSHSISDNSRFWLVDVGSSGGLHSRWQRFSPYIKNCGFEPNEEEFKKLSPSEDCVWINAGLAGASGKRELCLTRAWQNSSLLRPNQALLKTLEWGDAHDVVSAPVVDCITLDEALEKQSILPDFIKIDTQGTELEILTAGAKSLKSTVCVELEVEFVELYSGQPLFAEVDQFMRQNGFYLCDLSNTVHVKQRGRVACGGPKGRIISADALYYREHDLLVDAEADLSTRHHRITAQLIGYLAYGLVDLAVSLADHQGVKSSGYKMPDFLRSVHQQEAKRKHVGNLYPYAYPISRAIKKLGRLLTPSSSSLWSPELGNPRLRKYE